MPAGADIKTTELKRPLLVIAGLTLACLIPFVTKAFHIDDTLFLWIGRQIQADPLDFYGFNANWYGREMPMAAIFQNPPLTAYYIALVAAVAGWQEVVLHIAFWLPALGVSLGVFVLARKFCRQATLAALVAVLTPAFLVMATNVMADVMLLCFFTWAVAAWVYGLEQNRSIYFIGASIFITLAMLTKYFGASLIPLLLVYALCVKRRLGWWAVALVIPLLVMTAYQLAAVHLYGRGLLTGAAAYALAKGNAGHDMAARLSTTLVFSGGSLASALFLSPCLWSRRSLGPVLGTTLAAAAACVFVLARAHGSAFGDDGPGCGQMVQLTIFAIAGAHILALAVVDLHRNRDAKALLLFLWVMGVFVFAGFINWSVNARVILPMAPAVGILVARQSEHRHAAIAENGRLRRCTYIMLLPAAIVALAVAWADYTLADSQRSAAGLIDAQDKDRTQRIWFQGHWGFQYYMQRLGYRPLDLQAPALKSGDVVVTPINNSNARLLPRQTARVAQVLRKKICRWLTTMQMRRGAGFYAHQWGPLPFVLGPVPDEVYLLYEIEKPDH